ncbi:MAG: PKD domain-containing protein [Ginsengibacter sp.]
MKRFLYLIISLGLSLPAFAIHIVGGEMIYEYLGPGANPGFKKYRITLKLFRDQFSGGAPMPVSVFIGVFDGVNQYEGPNQPYEVPLTREDDVTVNPFPPCVVNADPISYHVGLYVKELDLPNNVNGYTATYQTCCRVSPLANVSDNNSSGAGSTYSCYIPPYIDNSPQFSTNVSLICRARSFNLDFSAKDADVTDSLVYSFCNAYDGGAATNANNINPAPPAYASVIYNSGFSAANPLGSLVTIDSKTGIISGVAPDAGKYVVCVCVQSYKNGIPVGEHRKDFIVKIGECDFAGATLLPRPTSCDGFTVTFSNFNNSPQNETYFWDFGVPSLQNDTSNLQSPTFTYPDKGTYVYKLVINRNQPCGDSALQTIKVYPGFSPGFKWTGQCINSPIQFTDTTKSKYGNVNSWRWNFGDPFTLADSSNKQTPAYTYGNSGSPIVSLIVGDDNGCVDTVTVPVSVISAPVVTGSFSDTTYCGKDTIQLHAKGNFPGTFSWTPATTILNANTADPLVYPAAFTSYIVKFDAGGCIGLDTINVYPKTDLSASVASSASAICEEDSVTLTALTNYNNPIRYLWGPAATLFPSTTQKTRASPMVNTIYTVVARWGNNCTATANTAVTVKKLAVPDAGPDTSYCEGSPGVMLNVTGGDDYVWSPSAGLSNTNIANPIARPASTTSYVVSAGVAGCARRRTDTVLVVVRKLPVVSLTPDTLICDIDTLQLFAFAAAATKFSWTPGYIISNQNIANPLVSPDVPTTYYVQVTDGYKCVSTDSVFVDAKRFVTIQTANDTTICQGDIVKLNTVSDALHYSWTPPATLDNGSSKSPGARPLTNTTYQVTGSIGKCQATDNITITVVPYPKVNAGKDTAICFNTPATLHASGGINYSWSPPAGLSDPSIPDPVASPDQSTQYIVSVTDDKGCPKPVNDTVFIKTYPKIIANAGGDTDVVIDQPLQLHATGGQVYLWTPPTGLSNANIADPVAMLHNNQQYVLKATNSIGCNGTDTIDITVYKVDPGLYIPNAFSPNGDNLNEVFRPVPIGMKSLTYFKIFNRFGQLIFSTNKLKAGWDGTFNGKPQNPDVYVWIAEGIDFKNTKISKKGTVVLIR